MPKKTLQQVIATIDDVKKKAVQHRHKLAIVLYLLAQARLEASQLLKTANHARPRKAE